MSVAERSARRSDKSEARKRNSDRQNRAHIDRFRKLNVGEIYDLIPGMVVVMDTEHTILDLNEPAASAAGKHKHECIGRKYWDLFDNPGCRAGTCAASEAVRAAKVCEGEAFPTIQGKEIPVLVSTRPRLDQAGQVVGVVELVFPAVGDLGLAREVSRLADLSLRGELSTRIDESKFQGRHLDRAKAINNMLEAVVRSSQEAAANLLQLAKGDLTAQMVGDYKGGYAEIKKGVNGCIATLNAFVEAMTCMADSHRDGAIDEYVPEDKFEGAWRDLASGCNRAVKIHVNNMLKVLTIISSYAEGDFGPVLEKLPGEQVLANEKMDLLRNNLLRVSKELSGLSEAALNGDLASRGNDEAFAGDWRKLVGGINELIEAIVAPVREASDVLEMIAAGDLTAHMVEDYRGEHAVIKDHINAMTKTLRASMGSIAQNAQALASASEELTATSQQMSANAEETSAQANVVSASALQVDKNLQTVATGIEEMSTSIKEIAKNAHESAKVATGAVKVAEHTNQIVSRLGDSSTEIGQVIKVITSIAQQTNLLALNATIEAARAGEAGKGFAVVANEVKELAKQTAKSTEDISRKIEAIQGDTKSAVTAIGQISMVINQLNDISNTIAIAVEQQSATTNEMARNIGEAATGSGEITRSITGVADAAKSTSHGAQDSLKASQALAQMATELRALVTRFKVDSDTQTRGGTNPKTRLAKAGA
jgi:methyl-accepting chemotaxis protein